MREQARGSAHERGYTAAWTKWRPAFRQALISQGIYPSCGAALPTGPRTQDSQCKAQGLLVSRSQDGTDLHFDHEPPLTDDERKDPRKVMDANRIQLLCSACHSVKTANERGGW
jgi:hypothetical protein